MLIKKVFPQKRMAVGENRFAPELNEKEVIELLENATPGSVKKNSKVWHENTSRYKLENLPVVKAKQF